MRVGTAPQSTRGKRRYNIPGIHKDELIWFIYPNRNAGAPGKTVRPVLVGVADAVDKNNLVGGRRKSSRSNPRSKSSLVGYLVNFLHLPCSYVYHPDTAGRHY